MTKVAAALLTAILAMHPITADASEWKSAGTLSIPPQHYTFLATTPGGDLLIGSFNESKDEVELPALVVRDPTGASPQLQELCRVRFPAYRGFGGIACDLDGNFYVSGDLGESGDSFIAKFRYDGSVVSEFGQNGQMRPGRRCLGVTTVAGYVLAASDWGYVRVYDSTTGRWLGDLAKSPTTLYMRDIAVDSRTLKVYGVGSGSVVAWEGGTPWKPTSYTFSQILPGENPPIAGEGITIDPFRNGVIICPPKGGAIEEVYPDGRKVVTPIPTVTAESSLVDTALSFDGTTLFISDYLGRKIHVMKRDSPADEATLDFEYVVQNSTTATGSATAINWSKSYEAVLQQARESKRPMLVYFRSPKAAPCQKFEKNVLLTSDFGSRAKNLICVFEDAEKNPMLAAQFGVTRVPHIVVMSANGEVAGEFRHPINQQGLNDLLAKMGQ